MKRKLKIGDKLVARIPKTRYREEQVTTLTITKVGRLYFYGVLDGMRHEEAFENSTWYRRGTNTQYNNPIHLFDSEGGLRDFDEKRDLCRGLADKLRYVQDWEKLDLAQLRGINSIVIP